MAQDHEASEPMSFDVTADGLLTRLTPLGSLGVDVSGLRFQDERNHQQGGLANAFAF